MNGSKVFRLLFFCILPIAATNTRAGVGLKLKCRVHSHDSRFTDDEWKFKFKPTLNTNRKWLLSNALSRAQVWDLCCSYLFGYWLAVANPSLNERTNRFWNLKPIKLWKFCLEWNGKPNGHRRYWFHALTKWMFGVVVMTLNFCEKRVTASFVCNSILNSE